METSLSREEKRRLKKKERKKKQRQQLATERIQLIDNHDQSDVEVSDNKELEEKSVQETKTNVETSMAKSICEKCNTNKIEYICKDCNCSYCALVFSLLSFSLVL